MNAAVGAEHLQPLLDAEFMKEMVRQMRALDSYGTSDGLSVESMLAPYVLSQEKRRDLPAVGNPDEPTLLRLNAFYNAIAVMIEQECGLMAVPLAHVNHEGFGRALITVGKLVVMDKTLRDVHRFGFDSLAKMKTEADKILSVALEIVGRYPDVAGL